MAQLNNANATSSAPSTGPSIEAMMNALGKAQAANDSNAVLEIQGMLKSKFGAARQKAQAAGDNNAVQEIDSRLQQILSGQGTQAAPIPVAPPPDASGTNLAPRAADGLAVPPGEAPAPVQQGVPPAEPSAPEAPVAAPQPSLAPAAAPPSTADILSGRAAAPAPAATAAPAAPKPTVTDAGFNTDPKWISMPRPSTRMFKALSSAVVMLKRLTGSKTM